MLSITVAYMPSYSFRSVWLKSSLVTLGVTPSAGPFKKCFDSWLVAAAETDEEDIVAGVLRWIRAFRSA